jgi:hypothetical protein
MRAVSFFGAGITAAAARAGETRATGADGGGFAGDRVGR